MVLKHANLENHNKTCMDISLLGRSSMLCLWSPLTLTWKIHIKNDFGELWVPIWILHPIKHSGNDHGVCVQLESTSKRLVSLLSSPSCHDHLLPSLFYYHCHCSLRKPMKMRKECKSSGAVDVSLLSNITPNSVWMLGLLSNAFVAISASSAHNCPYLIMSWSNQTQKRIT